ncbi:TIR domain-containing protein [Clostridium estertheticum]|uniref:TIR domain-containing protein n=1 Tax=Clostridium estertheticum TaxID=238834 RepID=A0AA47EFU2_9CLOT|nr:TIR domain-containing protein [Clostridium estertheticum]MBU3157794.1 TIR domain-containing protein [Clostridium estertheticum]WAG59431.1 TIR domain-containing protein [Clostridium estertheticum]
MAHKTFISYKYTEARGLRDDIIEKLGDDSKYYNGETSDSADLTDTTTENIKDKLRDMLYSTSVTIVIISPNMTYSKWIDWEIEYSLKEITRKDKTSRTNGIVGVLMKYNGGYGWIETNNKSEDGCSSRDIDTNKLYSIIYNNRFNLEEPVYVCNECQTVDSLTGSYISLINEDVFLSNPSKYIDNAFEKSDDIDSFKITKSRS